MFDKVSEAAERLAVHVSRRDFFGWAGKSALAVVGVVGGILAFPADARAGNAKNCCIYATLGVDFTLIFCGYTCVKADSCPTTPPSSCPPSAWLNATYSVSDCGQCKG